MSVLAIGLWKTHKRGTKKTDIWCWKLSAEITNI